jgi:hypothetical protein
MSGLALGGALGALVVATGLCPAQVGTDLVGADELLVLVDDGAAEGAFLDHNGCHDESRADFHERDVGLALADCDCGQRFGVCGGVLASGLDVLCGFLLGDLVAADPDFAVAGESEAHDVVGERLDFAAARRHAEGVGEELLDYAGVGLLVEAGVEAEDGTRALEAVAGEVELLGGVDVLAVHLDGGTVGRLGQPDVEILAFAGFEEEDVVAVVEVGELVELRELGLGVEFGVFARVGKERVQVVEEVAVSFNIVSMLRSFSFKAFELPRIPHGNTS